MSIYSDLLATWRTIFRVRKVRRFRTDFFQTMEDRGPLPDNTYETAIYFADTPRNIYQLRQWFQPFEELNLTTKVVIIARSMRTTLKILDETTLPVEFAPTVADIEDFMSRQPLKAVFYPNQNAKNFHSLRNHGPLHIWINHGESDKASMTTNQVKAYDYVFVAGQAAKDRLQRNVRGFDVDKHVVITGRPQIDSVFEKPELPVDDKKIIFYSPTWEGDRPSMNYSSLLSHGEEIITAILANPNYRLIFRAHPSTGNIDKEYKVVLKHLISLIEAANLKDPAAFHLVDTTPGFGWQLEAADYCVADVSAVAFDWLPTTKPIFIAQPSGEEAFIEEGGLISKLPMLTAQDSTNICNMFERSENTSEEISKLSEYYFGETAERASTKRWLTTLTKTIQV